MQHHGRHWFPKMLGRSQFNQRVRDLWAALVRLQQIVAEEPFVPEWLQQTGSHRAPLFVGEARFVRAYNLRVHHRVG
jgi:hypothetical protein